MSDLIDRNIVNQALTEYIEGLNECTDHIAPVSLLMGVQGIIRTIPNAEKKGTWIDEGFYSDWHPHHAYRCSVCGEHIIEASYQIHEYKYCFNCGAKMEVGNE